MPIFLGSAYYAHPLAIQKQVVVWRSQVDLATLESLAILRVRRLQWASAVEDFRHQGRSVGVYMDDDKERGTQFRRERGSQLLQGTHSSGGRTDDNEVVSHSTGKLSRANGKPRFDGRVLFASVFAQEERVAAVSRLLS